MLSDEAKTVLSDFVLHVQDEWGQEGIAVMAKNGPASVIQTMLGDQHFGPTRGQVSLTPSYYDNLKANREEAERYLAGLLGLC